MKHRYILTSLIVSVLLVLSLSCKKPEEVAVIETNYGRIVIEFFPKDAPKHVENFKMLANENFYDGTKFHRLVKAENKLVAIQGGDPNTISNPPSTWGKGNPNLTKVPAEFSAKFKHIRGIVSAARMPDDINSATSQFFICTGEQTQWDGKYSIYGRVIEGMDVVDLIAKAPVWPKTEMPLDPVVVNKVSIVKRSDIR